MSTRKIAVSTLWQLASQITLAALSILTVKFVAIALTKELAGVYNSAYGYLQLFGILADFGLYAVSVREVSSAEDQERVFGTLLTLRFLILCASLLLAILFVWILPSWRGTPLPVAVTIAAMVPFFTLLAGILRTIFQVRYRMHTMFIAEVLHRIFTTSLIAVAIVLGVRGSTDPRLCYAFLFVGGAGALLLFILTFLPARRLLPIRFEWDRALLRRFIRKAAPFGIAYLCVALYRQFDLTLIAALRPDFDLQNAYYGFVVRMTDMGFVIPTYLLNSALPILSQQHGKGEDTRALLGKTFLLLLTLGSISALFSLLWARPLTLLMTTPAYLSTALRPGSDTALVLQSAPLFLNTFILFPFYLLLTRGAWRQLVWPLALGAVLSLALNLILIPPLGFVGACITSILVHILLALLLFPRGLKALPMHFSFRTLLRWSLFTIILALALLLLRPLLFTDIRTAAALAFMSFFLIALAWATGLPRLLREHP